MVISAICLVFFSSHLASTEVKPDPLTYEKLLSLPPEQLERVDVAEMNLLCATGLPGSENMDIAACLKTLDQWTSYAREQTERNLHQYRDNPANFQNMEGLYRMKMLVTVLKLDLGCHYDDNHPNDEPADTFFAKSDYLFIHGLLGEHHAGTCSSIPVLITAVSRRLGYPVKLVSARSHLFARWDDGHDRFNIEASNSSGMVSHPDDYYRQWPKPISDEQMAAEGYLKSMVPREELAAFLGTRALCLLVNGRKDEAEKVCQKARELVPFSRLFRLDPGD